MSVYHFLIISLRILKCQKRQWMNFDLKERGGEANRSTWRNTHYDLPVRTSVPCIRDELSGWAFTVHQKWSVWCPAPLSHNAANTRRSRNVRGLPLHEGKEPVEIFASSTGSTTKQPDTDETNHPEQVYGYRVASKQGKELGLYRVVDVTRPEYMARCMWFWPRTQRHHPAANSARVTAQDSRSAQEHAGWRYVPLEEVSVCRTGAESQSMIVFLKSTRVTRLSASRQCA